jgi:hypothetical protein
MRIDATDIGGYLAKLPADRRDAITRVRDVINAKIAKGYEEKFQYGMISWVVPESVLPAKDVYNKQPLAFLCLGSQKNYMAVYLTSIYADPKERVWFEKAYKQSGKKLDAGKGCVRFASLDALPIEVIGEAVSRVPVEKYVARYREVRAGTKTEKAKAAKAAKQSGKTATSAKSSASKKPAKKTAAKKPAKKSR